MKSTFVKAKAVKRQEVTNISIFLQIGSGKKGIETRAGSKLAKKYSFAKNFERSEEKARR